MYFFLLRRIACLDVLLFFAMISSFFFNLFAQHIPSAIHPPLQNKLFSITWDLKSSRCHWLRPSCDNDVHSDIYWMYWPSKGCVLSHWFFWASSNELWVLLPFPNFYLLYCASRASLVFGYFGISSYLMIRYEIRSKTIYSFIIFLLYTALFQFFENHSRIHQTNLYNQKSQRNTLRCVVM